MVVYESVTDISSFRRFLNVLWEVLGFNLALENPCQVVNSDLMKNGMEYLRWTAVSNG